MKIHLFYNEERDDIYINDFEISKNQKKIFISKKYLNILKNFIEILGKDFFSNLNKNENEIKYLYNFHINQFIEHLNLNNNNNNKDIFDCINYIPNTFGESLKSEIKRKNWENKLLQITDEKIEINTKNINQSIISILNNITNYLIIFFFLIS